MNGYKNKFLLKFFFISITFSYYIIGGGIIKDLYDLIFSLPPRSFTLVSVLFGFLLLDDLNSAEQNALANFLLLVGQVLETNSAQQAVLNNISNNADLEKMKNDIEFLKQQINK